MNLRGFVLRDSQLVLKINDNIVKPTLNANEDDKSNIDQNSIIHLYRLQYPQ